MKHNTVLLLSCLLFLSACRQDPSPTGIDLLPPDDLVNVQFYDSKIDGTSMTTGSFSHIVTGETSRFISVGQADGFEAHALIRWLNLPNDIGDAGSILSATMKLYVAPYALGDPQSQFSMEVREVASFWSSFNFRPDSVRTLSTRAMPGGMIRTFPGDSLEIALDSNVVRTWFKRIHEGKISEVYGVLLAPGGVDGQVRAFHSVESDRRPQLSIRMNLDGKDTVIVGALPEDTYVLSGPPLPTSEFMTHGGIVQRASLKMDVTAVPSGSTVNHVRLELTIDRANSAIRYRGVDSLRVYELSASGDTATFLIGLTGKSGDPDVLVFESFSLTQLVQRWVNDTGRNRGLAFAGLYEVSDLDLYRFFDGSAEPSKRPRLVVTYTRQP